MLGFIAIAWASPLDLNTATVEQLDALPGLGLSKAHAIVRHRDAHGPFVSVDQIAEVSSIGPGVVAILKRRAQVGPTVSESVPSSPPATEARMPLVPSAISIDPNEATVEELAALPGVSATKAEAIVSDRDANGPFPSCQDLTRVEGMGQATVSPLLRLCSVRP